MLFLGGWIARRLTRHMLYGLGFGLATMALLALGFASTFVGLAVGADRLLGVAGARSFTW